MVLSDVDASALAAAAASIPGAVALQADLAARAQVLELAQQAGAIDVLVNNAGLQHVSPVEDFDSARWDLILAVMLTAPFLLVRALLPGMYARGWGRIINVASVHGLIASPYKAAYVPRSTASSA